MEHTNEYPFEAKVKVKQGQANAWSPAAQPIRKAESNSSGLIEHVNLQTIRQPLVKAHACRISQQRFQKAQDRLARANRDLGETAAFMLALMTTVSAIEAVINIADNKIHLPPEYMQMAFDIYIVVFISILVVGGLRSFGAIHRRSLAEKEIDTAKEWIFEYCSEDQWLKSEG